MIFKRQYINFGVHIAYDQMNITHGYFMRKNKTDSNSLLPLLVYTNIWNHSGASTVKEIYGRAWFNFLN